MKVQSGSKKTKKYEKSTFVKEKKMDYLLHILLTGPKKLCLSIVFQIPTMPWWGDAGISYTTLRGTPIP